MGKYFIFSFAIPFFEFYPRSFQLIWRICSLVKRQRGPGREYKAQVLKGSEVFHKQSAGHIGVHVPVPVGNKKAVS